MGFPKTQGFSPPLMLPEIDSEPSGGPLSNITKKSPGPHSESLIAPGLFLGSKKDGMRRCLKSQHVWTRSTSS